MRSKTLSTIVLISLAALFLQCTQLPTQPDMSVNEVSISSTSFQPGSLTISAGAAVIWVNNDKVSHSVDSGTFMNPTNAFESSANIDPGSSDVISFSKTGTFSYYCSIHQSGNVKVGTIIVN